MKSRIATVVLWIATITVYFTTGTNDCLAYTLSPVHATGERDSVLQLTDSSRDPTANYANAFGIGGGVIQGDITFGYYALFGSATYARKLFGASSASNAAIECAVQYTSRTLNGKESGGGTIIINGVPLELGRGMSKSWMFDVSYMNTLLSDRLSFIIICTGNHPTSAGGGKCSEIVAVLRSLRSKDAAFRFLPSR